MSGRGLLRRMFGGLRLGGLVIVRMCVELCVLARRNDVVVLVLEKCFRCRLDVCRVQAMNIVFDV